ncbi:MAG: DUF72 domain-containing protein [Actinomycetota bacterium]|nr:DUF72 domain-containing protein [Actinomycetota bacterium]
MAVTATWLTSPAPTLPAPTLPAPTLPAPTLPAPTLPAPTLPAPAARSQRAAPAVAIGECRVLAGASSWSDRSLVRDGGFYPSRRQSAAERLHYYATRLPLAEAATTYRFPPTPQLSKRWADALPPGFTLDLRAWSLLSGAPTWPESLWPDLQGYVRPSRRDGAKLYRDRLPAEVVGQCWERFCHAISPLSDAGALGAVIFRYPPWFCPRLPAWEELAALPARMAGFRVAVELTSTRWFEGDVCEQTLGFLEELGIAFVCRDESPGTNPVVAATQDLALVRFPGRAVGPGPWRYRYSHDELASWVPAVRDLASGAKEVHLIMDNCWRTDAVDNAASLLELLG